MLLDNKKYTANSTKQIKLSSFTLNDASYNCVFFVFPFLVASCKTVKCPNDKHCVTDQNNVPHCVSCKFGCPTPKSKEEYICGADGVTYESHCLLRMATCLKGHSIGMAYTGKCKGRVQIFYCIYSNNI